MEHVTDNKQITIQYNAPRTQSVSLVVHIPQLWHSCNQRHTLCYGARNTNL